MKQSKFNLRQKLQNRKIRVFISLILLCLLLRSLPYFAPIHAIDIAQDQQAVEFSDRHGLKLGTLLTRDQNHTAVVPLNQVSPYFIQAIIAAEDVRFYQHDALDLKAIIRAFKESIFAGKIVSGASTITMQLARMLKPLPRNLSGKIQEIWLAWRLTAGMTKDQILSAYINRLPMGGNIYGLEAASRIYFNIPATDLNLAQASILAAIPNNPTYFNPYDYWARVKNRQTYILNRMVQANYITKTDADRAYQEKISLQSRQQGILAAPHFLFWLATQLPKQHPTNIYTTIDRPLQQFVETQVKEIISTLTKNHVHQGAALVIDNHTGEILAYVGSIDYFNESELGRNDGVQALRQPGSTLKPFLYELALEKRAIHPNTILADVPTYYAIPGAKLYSPTDYNQTFLGAVRVRIALANSLNIPAVRVLEKIGVNTFLNRLHKLGFTHLNQSAEYYGLGLALGSGEVSLWELAQAYFTLAQSGKNSPLITTFPQSPNPQIPAYKSSIPNPVTWQLITDILSDSHARATAFGVDSILALPFPAAVKTGTSSHYRDTWTIGFTTDYTVATWVGNFNGDRMAEVSGVTGAAPLWNRIMLHLHQYEEPANFPTPQGLVKKPICATSGLKPTPACTAIVQEYFDPEALSQYEKNLDNSTPSQRQILSPKNGEVFLIESNNPKSKLEFKLATIPTQSVEWLLNGEKLANNSSNSLFWQLRPGNWILEVKSGIINERVNFQVQLSNQRATPRGFSITKP